MKSSEKDLAYARAYYAAHREERLRYSAANRSAHPEERRARARAYAAAHREEKRAYNQAYGAAHLEERRVRDRTRYAAHPEERLSTNRAYAADHPEFYRNAAHVRRARLRASAADLKPAEEKALRAGRTYCPLCHHRMTDEPGQLRSKHLDHIVPINVGGTHTLANVRIICARCNQTRPRDGSDVVAPSLWSQRWAS